jgi:hypothetical protein
MTLYLRTVDANHQSHGGFQWPRELGAIVTAPDWQPTTECGNGLHGLPWGQGDMSLLDPSPTAVAQVVRYDGPDAVDLGGKHKFPSCTLIYVGTLSSAAEVLAREAPAGLAIPCLHVMAGDYGIATAGHDGTATAGDYGTATAGDYGTATAGDDGTATAGDYGTATAGDYGTATAGHHGTATAGRHGTATAGRHGTATAGDDGTATAGDDGTATAGHRGAVILSYYDDSGRRHFKIGYIDEAGILPNVAYRLDTDYNFVQCGTRPSPNNDDRRD